MHKSEKEWGLKKLSEVVELIMGQSPPSSTYTDKQKGLPFFQGKAEFGSRTPEVRKYCSKPVRIAEKNDILMSVRAPVGSLNIADQKCCIGRGLCAIRPSNKVDYLFLYHFLKSIEEKISAQGVGSTFTAINRKDIEKIEIPVPPLPIQKHIVTILEYAEQLKEKREQANKYMDTIIQSLFYYMFDDPVKNEKRFPIEKLNNICDVRDGTHDSPKYVNKGFPLITSKNVSKGYIDFNDAKFISKEDFEKVSKRSYVDNGDIIMPMIGTIGNPIVVNKKREFAVKNVALIKFKDSKTSNVYIKTLLSGPYFNAITKQNNRGGTQKFLALSDIRNIPIPLPSQELQKEFEKRFKKIESLKAKQSETTSEINTLFDALMQKAFKGELTN